MSLLRKLDLRFAYTIAETRFARVLRTISGFDRETVKLRLESFAWSESDVMGALDSLMRLVSSFLISKRSWVGNGEGVGCIVRLSVNLIDVYPKENKIKTNSGLLRSVCFLF